MPESGELQYLSRNKEIQARYGEWIKHQQEIWGSSGESPLWRLGGAAVLSWSDELCDARVRAPW